MVFKRSILSLLTVTTAAFGAALRTTDFQQSLNARALRNYVKNSGAEKNVTTNVTASGGSLSTTSSSPLKGGYSFTIDASSSAQTYTFAADDLQKELVGQTCEASFKYSGDATLYKMYATLGGTKVSADATLLNTDTVAQKAVVLFPCGGSTTADPAVVIEATSASAAAIVVDDVFLGESSSVGTVAQATSVLSAKKTSGSHTSNGNDQDVTSWDANPYDPYGAFNTTTGVYTVPFDGRCSLAGQVAFTGNATGSRYATAVIAGSASRIFYSSNLPAASGIWSGHPITADFSCVKGDTIKLTGWQNSGGNLTYLTVDATTVMSIRIFPTQQQIVVRPDAPGIQMTSYTPVASGVTNGTTLTNQTTTGSYVCSNGLMSGYITTIFSGAPGGGSGPFQWTLPLTADTAKLPSWSGTSTSVGTAGFLDSGTAFYRGVNRLYDSTHIIAQASDTGSEMSATTPVTIASGDRIGIQFINIPVAAGQPCGTNTQPLIPGSLFAPYTGTMTVGQAVISCTGSSAITYQAGTWLASVGNVSSGACAVTFSGTPFGNANYSCFFTPQGTLATQSLSVKISSKTTSGFTMTAINQNAGTTSASQGDFDVLCVGAK